MYGTPSLKSVPDLEGGASTNLLSDLDEKVEAPQRTYTRLHYLLIGSVLVVYLLLIRFAVWLLALPSK